MADPAFGLTPFSIEDLEVATLSGDTPGSAVDLFGVSSFNWDVEADSEQLRGDDQVLYTEIFGKRVTWSATWGAYGPDGLDVIDGGSVGTSGTTPNEIVTYTMSATPTSEYFEVTALARAADGGGFEAMVLKAKATRGPAGTLSDGAYSQPSVDGEGVGRAGNLMQFKFYETKPTA